MDPQPTRRSHQLSVDRMLLGNIPSELNREIIFRLPVATLLKLRCVCKAWRDMIDDPGFIRFHLDRQTLNSSDGAGQLVFIKNSPHDQNPCFAPVGSLVNSSREIETITATPLHHINPCNRFNSKGVYSYRVSSCNGVMLLSRFVENTVSSILWNPSTRESRQLPAHTIIRSHVNNIRNNNVYAGLGYDYTRDDYKVVNITQLVDHRVEMETMIYSLKSDSWRRIKDFTYCIVDPSAYTGVYLNGALHWLARRNKDFPLIIGIDLGTENYFQMQIPLENISKPMYCSRELNVLGGCISLNCFYFDLGRTMDIWLMKDHRVESSWSKLFSIENPDCYFQYRPVIYFKSRGIVLMENRRRSSLAEYVCLDLENMSTRRMVTVDGAAFYNACPTFNLETLVRLNTTKRSCKRKRKDC